MNLTTKEYEKIKRSVHFKRFYDLTKNGRFTVEQLEDIDNLINAIKGYGSLKNAKVAKLVVELLTVSCNWELFVDDKQVKLFD